MGDIYTNPPQSRNEAILRATIDGTEYTDPPQSRIEDLLLELKEAIEEGGGTGEGDMKKSVYDADHAVQNAGGIAAYVGDEITDLQLGTASKKNSTASVAQSSTDLVESGAVYDAIKNTDGWVSDNLVTIEMQSTTYSDVEITVYSDGTFKLNGTASANIIREIETAQSIIPQSGDYIFSSGGFGAVDAQNSVVYGLWIQKLVTISGSGSDYATTYRGDNVGFTADKQTYPYEKIGIYIKSGQSFDNVIVRPALYHISVDEQKADNSVIAPIENGTNASQAWSVGQHFMNGGVLKEVTNAIAVNEQINNGNSKDVKVSDALEKVTSTVALSQGVTAYVNQVKTKNNVCSIFLSLNRTTMTNDKIGVAPIPVDNFAFLPVYDTNSPFDIVGTVFIRGAGTAEGEMVYRRYNDASQPSNVYIQGTYVCQ